MTDEERQEDAPEGQEQAEEPAAEEPTAPEQPTAEEPASEEPAPEEPAPQEEQAGEEPQPPAEQPAAEQPAAEEPAPPEQPAAEQQPASDPAAPGREAEDAAASDKKPDLPPGAELEPIAIEEERELGAEERARREAEAEERAQAEAAATAETGEEPAPSKAAVALEGDARVRATGKRKSAIARVILLPGKGKFEVNSRDLEIYFPRPFHQTTVRQPLVATGYEESVDVRVRVHGGGASGQAGAVRHGVARALCEIDPELRKELKHRGLLTRDARRKERRKAGLKKARKRPQFSKR